MFLLNATSTDLKLVFDGIAYTFPALVKEKPRVVEIGDPDMAAWFLAKTAPPRQSPVGKNSKPRPRPEAALVAWAPPKGAKVGEQYEVAGRWFLPPNRQVQETKCDGPVSIHYFHPQDKPREPPKVPQAKLDAQRKEAIAAMPRKALLRWAKDNKLVEDKASPSMRDLVDLCFDKGFEPEAV